MLACTKIFLTEILRSTGRRTDTDRNAFWAGLRPEISGPLTETDHRAPLVAGVVCHLPRDLLKNRRGRSAMRLLGVPYRVIKEGVKIRANIEDEGRGWILLKTHAHRDRLSLLARHIDEFWHSLEGSGPDNQNKEQIRVYRSHEDALSARDVLCGRPVEIYGLKRRPELNGRRGVAESFAHSSGRYGVKLDPEPSDGDATGPASECVVAVHPVNLRPTDGIQSNSYELHWRRAQEGTLKEVHERWKKSPQAAALLKEMVAKNKVLPGIKALRKYRCRCIKHRDASECDCKKCSAVDVNRARWHARRFAWRKQYEDVHGACACAICSDAVLGPLWLKMSRSMADMQNALMRCPQLQFAQYSLPGEPTFTTYQPSCSAGLCPKRFFRPKEACGFEYVFPVLCPAEATDDEHTWMVWEQRQRREAKEEGTKAFYSDEFVPTKGTRKGWFKSQTTAIADWLPHINRHRRGRH